MYISPSATNCKWSFCKCPWSNTFYLFFYFLLDKHLSKSLERSARDSTSASLLPITCFTVTYHMLHCYLSHASLLPITCFTVTYHMLIFSKLRWQLRVIYNKLRLIHNKLGFVHNKVRFIYNKVRLVHNRPRLICCRYFPNRFLYALMIFLPVSVYSINSR